MANHALSTPAVAAERLKVLADAAHLAALNLAMTYGVFHGINSARGSPVKNMRVAAAINSIQHDLLHLMAVRVCALCEQPFHPRPDDSSLPQIGHHITPAVRAYLIAADRDWRAKIGLRAARVTDVAKGIASFRRQLTALRAHEESLKRAKHFRDKQLAHVTVGHNPTSKVVLRDLWKLTRIALAAARGLRLATHRHDWDYLGEARRAENTGKALAKAIL